MKNIQATRPLTRLSLLRQYASSYELIEKICTFVDLFNRRNDRAVFYSRHFDQNGQERYLIIYPNINQLDLFDDETAELPSNRGLSVLDTFSHRKDIALTLLGALGLEDLDPPQDYPSFTYICPYEEIRTRLNSPEFRKMHSRLKMMEHLTEGFSDN